MNTALILVCTMNLGQFGSSPLGIKIDEANGTATIASTECPLTTTPAEFAIHCTAADRSKLTYIINRGTGEIVATSPAEGATLHGKCTPRAF
jgi:hypothetical protein